MGFGTVITVVKNLYKIMKPTDKIASYLYGQQAQGVELSPRLRNALAMYEINKAGNAPEPDAKDLYSFRDTAWFYLDILDELEANPALLPDSFADTLNEYKTYLETAREADEKDFGRACAKWEKKNHRTYQPKPRPNLIGEPLE